MTKPSTSKTRSGILGGTFDPVTLGHLGLAQQILEKLKLDWVWFIPAWQSPHKQDQTSSEAGHRLNMLKKALAPHPQFGISEIELQQKGLSYTINTLTALEAAHPATEWYLIMGMDTFRDFGDWKNARGILEKAHLAVATRPGYPNHLSPQTLQTLLAQLPLAYRWKAEANGVRTYRSGETGRALELCEITPLDVSSSEIRDRIRAGKSVKKMLPPEVEGYIMAHHLYQANPRPQPE